MAMIHKRDKPTYYLVVDSTGKVMARAPKSKILAFKCELERVNPGEKFEIRLEKE